MSIELMAAVWNSTYPKYRRDADGKWSKSHAKLLVMLKLADHASDDGSCYPAQTTIAVKSNVSRGEVNRIIKELEADSKLVITPTQKQNRYQLLFKNLDEGYDFSTVRLPHSEDSTVRSPQPQCAPTALPVCGERTQTISESSENLEETAPALFVKTKRGKKVDLSDEQFLQLMRETYDWVNVDVELKKANAWCITKGRRFTRAFFQDSWLSNFKGDTSQREIKVSDASAPVRRHDTGMSIAERAAEMEQDDDDPLGF